MSKKLGMSKPTIHDSVFAETVAHPHVPGRAFNITDPATKLITMIGGGFFNEPKYYDSNRSYGEFMDELMTTGKISSLITDDDGLSEQAREVIETAQAVANSENPENLLVIAAWARDKENGLKLRYTPQIMLCIAASNANTKKYVTKYAPLIIQRADEIRQVFAAYRHLFGKNVDGRIKGSLPHCLRKALSAAFANQSNYGLLKYNSATKPTFGDVLSMLSGKANKKSIKGSNWPLSKPMFNYLRNGIVGEDAPEILKNRQKLYKTKEIEHVTVEQLSEAGMTWENIISHFGSTKQAWEKAIPLMGEMALIRNLRNFEQVSISDEAWNQVRTTCKNIVTTNQLPFRFFTADKVVDSTNAKSITDGMLDNSCLNIPDLAGVSVVLVDNSGSAVGASISGKSDMRVSDCGNMLGAVLAKRVGSRVAVGAFGDSVAWVGFSESDSCMSIKKRIDAAAKSGKVLTLDGYERTGGVGGGTETGLWIAINDLTKRKVHVDRFILISDLCCYTQGDTNCGIDMSKYFGKNATVQSMISKYRSVVNPNAWAHSIDLQGYGKSQLRPDDKRSQLLSGWSEQVFALIAGAEGTNVEVDQKPVPTLDMLRQRYSSQQNKVEIA